MSGWRGQAVPNVRANIPPIHIILPGFIDATGNDITGNWYRVEQTFPLDAGTKIYYTAKVVPAATIGLDIKKSINNGSTFASILSSPLSLSGHTQTVSPAWVGGDLKAGDLLRVDITTSDTACAGVMLEIVPAAA